MKSSKTKILWYNHVKQCQLINSQITRTIRALNYHLNIPGWNNMHSRTGIQIAFF